MDKRAAALRILRDLQGKSASPIVVLLAMYIQKVPVTKKFLSTVLDTSYNTVSRIVDRLEHDGYILRDGYRRWILPGGQLPLPLPGFGLETSPSSSIPSTSSSIPQYPQLPARTKTGDVRAEPARIDTPGPPGCTPADEICISDAGVVKNDPQNPETSNFDVSGPTTTTCTSTMHEEKVVVVGKDPPETSKFDVSAPPDVPEDLAAAFHDAGLGQNIWPELAGYPWVTPRYVRAMAARIRSHPDPTRRTTGFLVHCIRSCDPEPDWCEICDALDGDHRPDCPRYVAPHMRYLAGKYADRLDH